MEASRTLHTKMVTEEAPIGGKPAAAHRSGGHREGAPEDPGGESRNGERAPEALDENGGVGERAPKALDKNGGVVEGRWRPLLFSEDPGGAA